VTITAGKVRDILVVGVGGQGVLAATDIIAGAFAAAGMDVKKSEVHGMAQRGGSVESHVRCGPKVHSPLIPRGEADVLVALEVCEALRFRHWVRPDGLIVTTDDRIVPMTVTAGSARYPADPAGTLMAVAPGPVLVVETGVVLQELKDRRTLNSVAIGILSVLAPEVAPDLWLDALRSRLPAGAHEVNVKAFQLGRSLVGDDAGTKEGADAGSGEGSG